MLTVDIEKIKVLADHDLFKSLCGNPQSITITAICRANQGRTLKEIYTLFKSDKIQSILSSEDLDVM